MKFGFVFCALAAALLSAVPVAAQNRLGNGGFEDVAPAPATFFPYWTAENTGDPNSVLILQGRDYANCCGVMGSASALDNRFVAFGASNSPTDVRDRIFQNFWTEPGDFLLQFDFAAIGKPQALHFSIYDFDRATFIYNETRGVAPGTNLDTAFQRFSDVYRSTGGQQSIQFSADGSDTVSADLLLDNVSITRFFLTTGGVPEPTTWAFLLVGFGAVGVGMRRRAGSTTSRRVA